MRIISGSHKGRRITAPKKLPVRPTTDRAKEGLFNILHHRIEWETINALDLFAGTGNISYELASRGVSKIYAVDQNRFCVDFIRKTSLELELPIEIIRNDVNKWIASQFQPFDLIFADPPYDVTLESYQGLIDKLIKNKYLKKEGLLIVEHNEHVNLEENNYFQFSRTYGSSTFSFFKQ